MKATPIPSLPHPPSSALSIAGYATHMEVTIRRLLWLSLLIGGPLLAPLVNDPQVGQTVPLLTTLLCIELFPVLWPRQVDVAAPTVAISEVGIVAAFSTAGILSNAITTGSFNAPFLGGYDQDQIASVVRIVILAKMLGSASYLLGFHNARLTELISKWFPRIADRPWNKTRLHVANAIFVTLFVITYVIFQTQLGVPLWDPTHLKEAKAIWRNDVTMSWMMRGVQLIFVPVFFAVVDAFASRRTWRIVFLCLVFVLSAYLNFRLGQRGVPIKALFALLLLFHLLYKKIPLVVLALSVFIAIAFMNYTLAWRMDEPATTARFAADEDSNALDSVSSTLSAYETDRNRLSALTLVFSEFPENRSFLLGQTWLTLPLAIIPRWIWPEKTDFYKWGDASTMQTLAMAPIPTPLLGLLYINFSWFGIGVGMFLWGAFHGGAYKWLNRSRTDINVVLLYTMIILYFLPTDMGISAVLQYIVPMWVVIRFITPKPQLLT
jgi:hypothetical protein